jgi:flagellar basal-body rod modification protein FlgD
MGDSMLAAQSLQASAMIGRSVLASGNRLELANGGAVGGIDLTAAAAKVVVTIYGPSGEAIEAIDLGKREAGLSTFAWDGRPDGTTQLPDGAYQFKVEALSGSGAKIEAAMLGLGRVQSVSLDGGVTLNVSNLGAVPVASVRQII